MKRLPKIFPGRIFHGLALATCSTAFTLLVLELGVRLLVPQQLITLRPDIWQPAEIFGWRHAPDADTTINVGEGDVRWRTDDRGHRISEHTPPGPRDTKQPLRVLALGDSFLEAIQVGYEDTTTAQLMALLRTEMGRPVDVINTGVGGWGPEQYLLEARSELARVELGRGASAAYDAVIVFLFVGNDRVYQRYDTYHPNQVAAPRRLRLPRALSKRELVDAIAYPINNALERRSHLFTLLKNRAKFLLMRVGLSAHHFPATLIRARNGITADGSPPWGLTAEVLTDIQSLTTEKGLPMLVVLLPGIYQVDTAIGARYAASSGLAPEDYDLALPSELLGPTLDAAGLTWIDTLPSLRQAHRAAIEAGQRPALYGNVDTHLAPAGHRVVAETILPWVREQLQTPVSTLLPQSEASARTTLPGASGSDTE